MRDIESRNDIAKLVRTFYEQVLTDDVIGHFFTEVTEINWEEHFPTMFDFWETMLLDNPVYKGNPMTKHLALHAISPMEPHHFLRWLELWESTVNTLFRGQVAETAVRKAQQIAGLIEYKTTSNM